MKGDYGVNSQRTFTAELDNADEEGSRRGEGKFGSLLEKESHDFSTAEMH